MSNFYSSHTLCSPYFMDSRFTTFTACLSSFFYSASLYWPIPLRSLLESSLSTLNPSPKINCHLISTNHSNSQVFALLMTAWTLWSDLKFLDFWKLFNYFLSEDRHFNNLLLDDDFLFINYLFNYFFNLNWNRNAYLLFALNEDWLRFLLSFPFESFDGLNNFIFGDLSLWDFK